MLCIYCRKYQKGKSIIGLDAVKTKEDIVVFHAGTKLINNKIVTNGGRVLNVVAYGDDIDDAQKKVYDAVSKISFEGVHYRKDIASKAIKGFST